MSTPDRDRRQVMRPRPVWVDPSGHWRGERDWLPGLLLEWRRQPDPRGTGQWEGLILWARGGGELPWSVSLEWMRALCIRPLDSPGTEGRNRAGSR